MRLFFGYLAAVHSVGQYLSIISKDLTYLKPVCIWITIKFQNVMHFFVTFVEKRLHVSSALRSGDTVTSDRIERCCYC